MRLKPKIHLLVLGRSATPPLQKVGRLTMRWSYIAENPGPSVADVGERSTVLPFEPQKCHITTCDKIVSKLIQKRLNSAIAMVNCFHKN